jgi:hypothetical protein
MKHKALVRRLQISCLGLDPIDPLRLLVNDVIAALTQPEQDHIPDARKMVTEQEPVALEAVYETIIQWDEGGGKRSRRELARRIVALYTTPPQRTWVGLTDEQITQVIKSMPRGIKGWMSDWDLYEFSKAIEAKLKENT